MDPIVVEIKNMLAQIRRIEQRIVSDRDLGRACRRAKRMVLKSITPQNQV